MLACKALCLLLSSVTLQWSARLHMYGALQRLRIVAT